MAQQITEITRTLSNKIAVVTGASRGAGKGIAIALGQAGTTVYVTGRSAANTDSPYGGSVGETAELVTKSGGKVFRPLLIMLTTLRLQTCLNG